MKKATTSTSLHETPSTAAGRQEPAVQVTIVSSECVAETRTTVSIQRTFVTKRGEGTILARFAPDQARTSSSTK